MNTVSKQLIPAAANATFLFDPCRVIAASVKFFALCTYGPPAMFAKAWVAGHRAYTRSMRGITITTDGGVTVITQQRSRYPAVPRRNDAEIVRFPRLYRQ